MIIIKVMDSKIFKQILHFYRRKRIKDRKFTIISNNCWGGFVYQKFGMRYESPTIGLIIPPKDYNKFIRHFNEYIVLPLVPLAINLSKNQKLFSTLENVHHKKLVLGCVGDVEICFLHYSSFEEAKAKWERRAKRIQPTIIFKNNDHNWLTIEDLKEWNELIKNKNSVFLTCNKTMYDISKACHTYMFPGDSKNISAVDETTFFKQINYIKLLNGFLSEK